ncbi:MAG TPA: hypothetical protein VGC35_05145 [Allosphingosinicella sp.]|jgi:hypothetical protein
MTEDTVEAPRAALGERFGSALDRAERIYLKVLRAALLVIATGLLLYAAWLGIWSLYKMSRSPDSVVEQPAVVAPDELTSAEMPVREAAADAAAGPKVDPAQQKYYADFAKRYFTLYRTRFEPFRQKEDKQLSRDQFDDAFLDSERRLQAAAKGELNFAEDKADLEALLPVMTEAAGKPQTQGRLQQYKTAKKVRVGRKVQRSRTEYRSGWNSYSTACENWFYSPVGCSERRAVQVPYTETVFAMQFPKGTQTHTQIFRAFQDRFFSLLTERREANRAEAERKRDEIGMGNLMGKLTLWTALQILGGFLVLMFFFLLIAIERHQRRLAAEDAVRA